MLGSRLLATANTTETLLVMQALPYGCIRLLRNNGGAHGSTISGNAYSCHAITLQHLTTFAML